MPSLIGNKPNQVPTNGDLGTLAFEDAESFAKKVQTIRENYFTNKASTIVESVVTDTPIEMIAEEKAVDPSIKRYMSALNNIK
jgi:hypothetical protein